MQNKTQNNPKNNNKVGVKSKNQNNPKPNVKSKTQSKAISKVENGATQKAQTVPVKKNLHAGHRQRVRTTLKQSNFKFTHVHQILEFLLFYPVVKKDTNEMAHELLNKFGSLGNVLDADEEDLKEIKGVGDYVAFFLNFMGDFCKHCSDISSNQTYKNIYSYRKEIEKELNQETEPKIYIIGVDGTLDLVNVKKITNNFIYLDIYHEIIRQAVRTRTDRFILMVNHLVGDLRPTVFETELALKLKEDLKLTELELLDFFIVSKTYGSETIGYYNCEFLD